eukprot:2906370-Pleurochrysis_carterae.AAC.1
MALYPASCMRLAEGRRGPATNHSGSRGRGLDRIGRLRAGAAAKESGEGPRSAAGVDGSPWM